MTRRIGIDSKARFSGPGRRHGQAGASRLMNLAVLAALVVIAVPPKFGWALGLADDRNKDPSPAQGLTPLVRIEVRGTAAEAVSGSLPDLSRGAAQRERVDPCLGNRWQWLADPGHPARPARLILLEAGSRSALDLNSLALPSSSVSLPSGPIRPLPPFAVRAGDRVTVVQETPILRARFQAVALESAPIGRSFRVRLIGGSDIRTGNQGMVVLVRAASTGEVVWLAAAGNLP
jgi:hypothetical protein